MATVTYVDPRGSEREVDVAAGTSVMRAALANGVAGIVGECGGQAMCATCHVYVRDDLVDDLPARSVDEDEMLEETAEPRDERRSRLGCQLVAGEAFERLVVDVPARQV